jgi:hypothetical protein
VFSDYFNNKEIDAKKTSAWRSQEN